MADLVFIGLTAAFFALCAAYVSLCDRILGPDPDRDRDVVPVTSPEGVRP